MKKYKIKTFDVCLKIMDEYKRNPLFFLQLSEVISIQNKTKSLPCEITIS